MNFEIIYGRVPSRIKAWLPYLILIAFIGLHISNYYADMAGDFPRHYHSWAQFDRYAIALGFTENGMDFFHPTTHSLYKPYGYENFGVFGDPVTAVDFPIHEYLIAVIMKITGTTSPGVYRWYSLAMGTLFVFGLYHLTLNASKSRFKGLLITMMVLFSSVFMDYQFGMLPSIHSLATLIFGFNFLHKYFSLGNRKHLIYSVIFITLSALVRTPFTIYLLGLIGLFGFKSLKEKQLQTQGLLASGIGFMAVVGYFLYNSSLRATHGSMFLGKPLTPKSWDQVTEVWIRISDRWWDEYLSPISYFVIIIFLIVWLGIRKTAKKQVPWGWRNYSWIIGAGALGYSILMLPQFYNHDYYFLDTLFVPVLLLFWIALCYMPQVAVIKNAILHFSWTTPTLLKILGLIILYISMNSIAYLNWKERHNDNWNEERDVETYYKGKSQLLTQWGVPEDAKLLVIGGRTAQGPLIFLDRFGYSYPYDVMADSVYDHLTGLPFDYVVGINDWLLRTDTLHKELKYHLRLVGTNDSISAFKFSKEEVQQTFEELYTKQPQTKIIAESNLLQKAKHFNSEELYFDFWKIDHRLDSNESRTLFLDLTSKMDTSANFNVAVVQILNGEHQFSYFTIDNLDNQDWRNSKRSKEIKGPMDQLHVYFYNPNKQEVDLKEVNCSLFER